MGSRISGSAGVVEAFHIGDYVLIMSCVGLDGGPIWNQPVTFIMRNPGVLESELGKMGLLAISKQDL